MGKDKKNGIYLSRFSIFLIVVLLVLNTILVINNIFIRNRNGSIKEAIFIEPSEDVINIQDINPELLNSPCPEFVGHSIDGSSIALRSFAGKVIIIRFSEFLRRDLPNIIFLQDLVEKYKDFDTCLFFINSRGNFDGIEVEKFTHLTFPVIEDDGTIRALLNANGEDTIIVGRDFNIKYRSGRLIKTSLFDELLKRICINPSLDNPPVRTAVAQAIKEMVFQDVYSREGIKVYQEGKPLFLVVASSICMDCEESRRFQLLRKLAQNIDPERMNIRLILGKGNSLEALDDESQIQSWKGLPVSLGIIRPFSSAGGTGECQSVVWLNNFCDNGLCYEEYEITCVDGRKYYYYCYNADPNYWCPLK